MQEGKAGGWAVAVGEEEEGCPRKLGEAENSCGREERKSTHISLTSLHWTPTTTQHYLHPPPLHVAIMQFHQPKNRFQLFVVKITKPSFFPLPLPSLEATCCTCLADGLLMCPQWRQA